MARTKKADQMALPQMVQAPVMRFSMVRDGAVAYAEDGPKMVTPAAAAESLRFLASEPLETLAVLVLGRKNEVLSIVIVYRGSVDGCVVKIGEILRPALVTPRAAAMIVAHNHPSGDPAPSPDDLRVTKQLVEAGKLLDIEVLDHIVVAAAPDTEGGMRWISIRERFGL